jgi:hypothetical protein
MVWLPRLVCALLLAAPLIGCGGSEPIVEAGERWDEGALRGHLRQLTEPVASSDSVRVARRTLYAARRMEAAGLMPARDPSFLVRMRGADPAASPRTFIDPTQAHVLGYVSGRHPSHYDELVLVTADLDSRGAVAALEGARALAERARFTQIPERTVLFALWSPPRTGGAGLADFLANPMWALSNVTRAFVVTADSVAAAASLELLEGRGIPSEVVAVADQSVPRPGSDEGFGEEARTLARTVRLTDALYERVLAASTPRDSTAVLP